MGPVKAVLVQSQVTLFQPGTHCPPCWHWPEHWLDPELQHSRDSRLYIIELSSGLREISQYPY